MHTIMRGVIGHRLRRGLAASLLCVAIGAGSLACAAPSVAAAEAPAPPSIGGVNGENLSIGRSWGLYEQWDSQVQDGIGVVGAPMPFLMDLMDSGQNRLFVFIQHRLPGGPYCAETPAQLENPSVELTAAAGDPTIPGPEYTSTYVWTPVEAGEYALCAYLDASAADQPAATNFLKLTADPAPGQLAVTVAPEAGSSASRTVQVQGTAVVSSELTASVQQHGQSCTLPDGGLAGRELSESPHSPVTGSRPGAVGPGPFTASYSFTAEAPGPYEVCAYLTPAPTEQMYFGRPYEVGSSDFSVLTSDAGQPAMSPVARNVALPPALSWVSMSSGRLRALAGAMHAAKRAPVGTRFHFVVSAPATVTIAVARVQAGILRGGACVPLSAATGAAGARRCSRRVAVGTIVRVLGAGKGVIRFTGAIGHRDLPVGSYIAELSAHNANGRSGAVGLSFRVVP